MASRKDSSDKSKAADETAKARTEAAEKRKAAAAERAKAKREAKKAEANAAAEAAEKPTDAIEPKDESQHTEGAEGASDGESGGDVGGVVKLPDAEEVSPAELRRSKLDGQKKVSVLLGLSMKEPRNEGGPRSTTIVIGPEHWCTTIEHIKEVMIELDIMGDIHITREKPIRRVVKQVTEFA